jgi:O-antigen biosynthesis protein WbqP
VAVLGAKRVFDLVLSIVFITLLLPLMLVLALSIKIISRDPILHWSKRVGRNNKLFLMPKFRTMKLDTPQLATHVFSNAEDYLTPLGPYLRRASLDELPQLWSIVVGDLSFVGPRPALFNQDDLVALRTAQGIHLLVPGLTGWAQVNGRDELPLSVKVQYDHEYLLRRSILFDLKIMVMTPFAVLRGEGPRRVQDQGDLFS